MKVIAFYLPQFHTFPENDAWWGKGFVEWTNTKKAKPLFEGHDQPQTPYQEDYYDLMNPETFHRQIRDAKEYGLYGFCFYHYWFKDGKKLMEKPIEMYLRDKSYDFPMCLCWANEPWTRAWDGGNKKIIMPQDYGNQEDWQKHFDYFLPFFQDERYIRDDEGRPLLLIYRPEQIPHLEEMLGFWRSQAKEAGLPGLCIISQGTSFASALKKDLTPFDNYIMYEPGYTTSAVHKGQIGSLIFTAQKQYGKGFSLYNIGVHIRKRVLSTLGYPNKKPAELFDYDRVWKEILRHPVDEKAIPGAFTSWDNTARRGNRARVIQGTPEKFEKYLTQQIRRTKNEYHKDFLFLTAWNEWAEGAHLEADVRHGYGYLEGLRNALKKGE